MGKREQPNLSVLLLTDNDATTIASMIIRAQMACRSLTDDYEILVVNDGSHDHTASMLHEIAQTFPHIRIISHTIHPGYGGALQSGLFAATKDAVLYMPGDARYDPYEIRRLYAALTPLVDIVNGYVPTRRHNLITTLSYRMLNVLFGIRMGDCDFQLIRRSCLEHITLTSYSEAIRIELTKKLHTLGYVFADVPVRCYPHMSKRSRFFTVPLMWQTAVDLWFLWRFVRRSGTLKAALPGAAIETDEITVQPLVDTQPSFTDKRSTEIASL